MKIRLRNPRQLVAEVSARVLTPPPPINFTDWAEENITFKTGSSFLGPYRRETFPVWEKVLSWLQPDHPCEEVYVAKSAQSGGTIIAMVFLLGTTCLTSTAFMYVLPTESLARRWVKEKLQPMVQNCPPARAAFGAIDGKENSADFIKRKDGLSYISIANAGSENSLSSYSAQAMVDDELSKWEDNKAGNPESQADSRMGGVLEGDGKRFKLSTPLMMPGCRITEGHNKGTQTKLYIACPQCEHEHPLDWKNMVENIDPERLEETCYFVCPECNFGITQKYRDKLVAEAHAADRYVDENPNPSRGVKSFHTWVAYFAVKSWAWIGQKWLDAKGDPESEQNFYNDVLGLAYEVEGNAPKSEKLKERYDEIGHVRGIIPFGFPILTMGIDVQDGWMKWQIVAWGPFYRRAVIDVGLIDFGIDTLEGREALDDLVASSWLNEAGRRIAIDYTAIDGNFLTDDVESWVRTKPTSKVMMVRGVDQQSADLLSAVKTAQNKDFEKKKRVRRKDKRFYNLAVTRLKLNFYRNLAKEDPESIGFVLIPRGMPESYFEELTAEKRFEVRPNIYKFVPRSTSVRSEDLDTMNYAEAAAIRTGLRKVMSLDSYWERKFEERETPPDEPQMDLEDVLLTQDTKTDVDLLKNAEIEAVAEATQEANVIVKPKLTLAQKIEAKLIEKRAMSDGVNS